MAARLCPDNVRQTHQSLHHVVAHAPWSDEDILEAVRQYALPAMQKQGPIEAWIVDDTGFVKKGTHSVGVTRQYCGQVGKQENCRVAVSLSISTAEASLPIAWRLYLPELWTEDKKRRKATGIPRGNQFSNQAGNCLATNSHRPGPRDPRGSGSDRRRVWERHGIPRWHHRIRVALCAGYPVVGERVETRPGATAQAEVERNRTSHQVVTPRLAGMLRLQCASWR